MIRFLGGACLCVCFIDLTIAFIWFGIVVYKELIDTYRKYFGKPLKLGEKLNEYRMDEDE